MRLGGIDGSLLRWHIRSHPSHDSHPSAAASGASSLLASDHIASSKVTIASSERMRKDHAFAILTHWPRPASRPPAERLSRGSGAAGANDQAGACQRGSHSRKRRRSPSASISPGEQLRASIRSAAFCKRRTASHAGTGAGADGDVDLSDVAGRCSCCSSPYEYLTSRQNAGAYPRGYNFNGARLRAE